MSLYLIAEIGINHNGDLGIAKELIDAAALMAVHPVDHRVGLFLGASNPVANTSQVILVHGGLQAEPLVQHEFLLQELDLGVRVKLLFRPSKAKGLLRLLRCLVTQLLVSFA